MKTFQLALLKWYDNHARILPWRDNPTPYRVWVSEIMLQQTRVDTVKPYFEKFIKNVPDIQALAILPEEELLKLWEGLGYYSRAMNLKKAAILITEQFGGQIPSDVDKLKTLPGVGAYTSGAIASISFDKSVPAIDGNVLRVISRLTANQGDIIDKTVKREIEQNLIQLLPSARAGDFNQALMELGATVCVHGGSPKCEACPVQSFCAGYDQGIAAKLPVKGEKKARRIELKTVCIISYQDLYAIRQRVDSRLLANLWEFPLLEGHLSIQECTEELKKWGITVDKIVPLTNAKHIFSHLEWHMIGYFITAIHITEHPALIWVTKKHIEQQYSIPSAFKKYKDILKD